MSVLGGAPAPLRTIGVAPLAPALGAEITGVDLQQPIIGEQAADLREALTRHLVLFFREQDVTEEQQLAVASVFGPPVSASLDPTRGPDVRDPRGRPGQPAAVGPVAHRRPLRAASRPTSRC